MDRARLVRLNKLLAAIQSGRQALVRGNNEMFLEAICAQTDPPACISSIVSSSQGLQRLQTSLRFDSSPAFYNKWATSLIIYLSSPDIALIDDGRLLQKVVVAIVEPPIFFTPYLKAYQDGLLEEKAHVPFAWLILQLVSLPSILAKPYRQLTTEQGISDALLTSAIPDVQAIARQISSILSVVDRTAYSPDTPGGRHDNDFADFREISILPTAQELICKAQSFLRPSAMLEDPETLDARVSIHLDNQFRLLREDMLYEMREELQVVLGLKKGKFRGLALDGLILKGIHHETRPDKKCKWGLTFKCANDVPRWFDKIKPELEARKEHLGRNRNIFKHGTMVCLVVDGEVVAFPLVNRDEELLAQTPPIVVLQLHEHNSIIKTLTKLASGKPHVKLFVIDTAVFAYEPVLKALQERHTLPFSAELLFWTAESVMGVPSWYPQEIVAVLQHNATQNLQSIMQTPKPVVLDRAQAASLLSGLTQRVSLIQGPPGTGKSYIGALLAKALHDDSEQTILVVCYTNHALDQFLEDLLDIGIPESSMVRLGGKSLPRTEGMKLQNQAKVHTRGKNDWNAIDLLKAKSSELCYDLDKAFREYQSVSFQNKAVLDYLMFEDAAFCEAFRVPESSDGMQQVQKGGKDVESDYLLDRWIKGKDAGGYTQCEHIRDAMEIWNMPLAVRQAQLVQWRQEMFKERVELLATTARDYNQALVELDRLFNESNSAIIKSKRIIGCTTTAAAMYRESLSAAQPSVLLVEEAGEILESHILTALSSRTERLILIGDHKQLRPKVNNYLLTVEKGEGLDLNRSLFERLVLKGYPHETLTAQHRMRPEISDMVRRLTYPELADAPGTKNRPNLRGIQDNVVFISHEHPEDNVVERESSDNMAATSKQNQFEVQIILKIVRYLGLQGYGTDDIVILTPYLGQLRALQLALMKDNDPVLNDLDYFDLVRAGLMTPSAAKIKKKPIRLATIDNYQGEQSDIVVVSLTRSNPANNIGFMFSPERLTVMLSRARNAFIMIGNPYTFMNSRKGGDIWKILFDLLRDNGHIYGGLPTRCERHKSQTAILARVEDFDEQCPEGGCLQPCETMLTCGLHRCPSSCHHNPDHSRVLCKHIVSFSCSNKHTQSYECHKGAPTLCSKCEHEQKLAEKKRRAAFESQEQQRVHEQKLAELQDSIAQQRAASQQVLLAADRKRAIEQKEKDLRDAKAFLSAKTTVPAAPSSTAKTNARPIDPDTNISQSTSTAQSDSLSDQPATSESGYISSFKRWFTGQRGSSPSSKADGTTPQPQSNTENHRAPDPPITSAAKQRWERQKSIEGAANDAIDAIMAMTGLEDVKEQMLAIKDKVDTAMRQNVQCGKERFNITMLGNPGTGKTTVARHYSSFLASVGILPGSTLVETTGSRLANDGVPGIKKQLEDMVKTGGGVIFIDEAYQLTSASNSQGAQVLDFLLAEIENLVGKVVFIFAGYHKEMEKFYEHNPGLPSRIPYTLHFHDYKDNELLTMWERMIETLYNGRMHVEGPHGIRGLYARIAIRRLGRGRGTPGFGNARSLEIMLAKVRERQAKRISQERRVGSRYDDFLFTKEDLIGPEPSQVMANNDAWKELQGMIGLGAVKKTVENLIRMVNMNYQRELLEKEPNQVSLNRVFLGSPGTGKTTVAKLYGRILADLGMLSNGEVVMKNPSDFVGAHLGQSESQTKAILASTVGKVLVIDEAYMLYVAGTGHRDSFKTAVVDTLVAEIQSVPGDDRCVLLLGYKQQMEEMFKEVNPGLSRRFSIENAFQFDDFTDNELLQALDWKLMKQDLSATDAAKKVAMEVLGRARNRPNFGNIGDVENLLSRAKEHYQSRQASLPSEKRAPDDPFEPEDFDPEFNRDKQATANLVKLFEDVVGCEDIVTKLSQYQVMAQNMKARNMDPRMQIPTSFVFKGPPGTGKTTTARKMGQVYYDMGFLSSIEVIECSASDLVGEYVGHTGPKTKKLFEKALGRVLFIDEAYRLGEGRFAQEAIDELVGLLTQETFRGKLLVILAGYDKEMNALMAVNTGLSSRFPDEIIFRNLEPERCLQILKNMLRKQSVYLDALDNPSSPEYARMVHLIKQMSAFQSWGNARDVETLSKKMVAHVFTSQSLPTVDVHSAPDSTKQLIALASHDAISRMEVMLFERRERETNTLTKASYHDAPVATSSSQPPGPPPPSGSSTQSTSHAPLKPKSNNMKPKNNNKRKDVAQPQVSKRLDARDNGVSDEVWNQLQLDKAAADESVDRDKEELARLQRQFQDGQRQQQARARARQQAEQAAQDKARNEAELKKLRGRLEAERRRERKAQEEATRRLALLEAARQEEARRRREEVKVQQKIRQMGLCVAGFQWIKQEGGYRCAGGSHYLSNTQLGII